MKRVLLLTVLAASTFAVSTSAQTLKPGLWEVTNQINSSSGEAEKAHARAERELANMPPEERRQMEETMAKHGMKLLPGEPGAVSARMCLTKAMVERNEIPGHHGMCTTTQQQMSGNTLTFAFSCTNPPSNGEGEYTFLSPESYSVKMTVNAEVKGKPETMAMEGSGKWLSPDCGSIKPLRPPEK